MRTMKHWALAAATASALALAGCGGGGSSSEGPRPAAPVMVSMTGVTMGYTVPAGTYNIQAGATQTVGDVAFTCASGGAACTVMVAADGTATYAADGGTATAMNSASYQAGLDSDTRAAEAMALAAARTAADMAADAAATASYSAQAAVQAVMDDAGSDQASYDTAKAKADAAMAAATAARAASDAAGRATTSADAEAQQIIAEMKQAEAETALADASRYAGMVTQAKADDDAEAEKLAAEVEARKMLADAKQAAMDAANMANEASMAASGAVEAQRASKDLSTVAAAAFARAEDAAADAAKAAGDAAVANNAAQAATTQADVDMYRQQAEEAQAAAELAQANAMSFAGMVASVKEGIDAANTETDMLAAAKTAAGVAAMKARDAADKAEEAAVAAEEAAPGSTAAMKARDAADAAETAAMLAEAENRKAQDATDSATAMTAQVEAEAQQNVAEGGYMTAKTNQDIAEDARLAAEQVQEKGDLADAQEAAQDLFDDATDGVLFHYNAVVGKAGDAMTQATNARASADRAAHARTNAAMADEQAKMAEAASVEAQAAKTRAETAKSEADAALQAAKDATTSEAAEAALADLRAANAKLTEEHTGETGAGMDYMTAKAAAEMAETAANTHVLSLFLAANGAHVMDLESTTTVDEKAAHVTSVGEAMAAIANAASGNQAAGTTASAAWPGDIAGDPDADPVVEAVPGMLSVSVDPAGSGTAIPFELGATREADDTATPPVTARIQTAERIPGLGAFTHGFDVWEDDGDATTTTDRARVIVFTNKTQDDPAVDASDAVLARSVENVAVSTTTLTKLGTKSGNTYTGAEYTPSDEAALMGTLTCPSGTTCSVDATTAADGTVTINGVTGYVFTGSRAAKAAVTAADADAQAAANNYLVFGLWLDESEDGDTDTFGAFASGGTVANAPPVALTGTATYTGNAAGAHHKTGEGVNWFHGDAQLTANFGAIDTDTERGTTPPEDTSPGTISGMISQIRVNGGEAMSTPIYLGQAPLTAGTATFNGAAFMGAATAPGASTHEFDGTWSGSFFGSSAAVVDDPETTEDETLAAGALAPAAAAGTFGVTKSEGTGEDMVVESFVGAFGAHK